MAGQDAKASAPRPQQPRRLLGLRVAALVEIMVFLGAALAVDTHLGDADRFASITPHPFWIIILLASVQYGAKEGLAAALAATAVLLVGNLPEQGFSEDLYGWLFRASREPLLWVFAALLLGEIRDAHRRERDRLAEALAEARQQSEGIALAYDRLAAIKDHLETRVAGQVRTVRAIFEASRSIEREETGQVLAGVQTLVATVLNPSKFSLFLLQDNVLEAALCEGWADDDPFARAFDQASPLFQAVVSHRRDLVVTRPSHGLVLGGEGLMAGPLTCVETDQIIGMLKIEAMDFLDLHPASVQHFHLLCEWIGWAYNNAREREEIAAGHHVDRERGLLSARLFEWQRDIAVAMARELDHDLTLLLIGLDRPEGAGAALQAAGARAIARAAEPILGVTEQCFDWRQDGFDAAVLLPGLDAGAAAIVAQHLLGAIDAEMAAAGLPLGVRTRVETLHRVAGALPRERVQ